MLWNMRWRLLLIQMLDVVLRVPPLFVLDCTLNGTFPLWMADSGFFFSRQHIVTFTTTWAAFLILCVITSFLVFTLSSSLLFVVYSVFLADGVLCLSYKFNSGFISPSSTTRNHSPISILFVQCLLAFCYNSLCLDLAGGILRPLSLHLSRLATWIVFLLPVTVHLAFPSLVKQFLPLLPYSAFIICFMDLQLSLFMRVGDIFRFLKAALADICESLHTYGVQFFLEHQWQRLHVPYVLLIFWVSRSVFQFSRHLALTALSADNSTGLGVDSLHSAVEQTLTSGSENWLVLFGMSSTVSFIAQVAHTFFIHAVGQVHAGEADEKHVGSVSAILFVILAMQTGLTGLVPGRRLIRLYRNLCLVLTAVLQFGHDAVHARLMSLSAQQTSGFIQHVRALMASLFLIWFPAVVIMSLWISEDGTNTWMLAVTALTVEIIAKVVVSLVVYVLFIIDSFLTSFWDRLDDYVFVIKALGSTVEFLIGVFLFGNGAWIFLFESGGALRAVMMFMHAYFNIWSQAKRGWQSFVRRRTAAKKISLLPVATESQLHEHNDVCAICYQELRTARVTKCRHLFHGVCLRKWLYVQDVCPICHTEVTFDNDGTSIIKGSSL